MTLSENMTDEVILMLTLHDDRDSAINLVVQAAKARVIEPHVGRAAPRRRECVFGLRGVINDDEVGPAPGKRATHRGRKAHSAARRFELMHGLAVREARGEGPLIPRRLHKRSRLAGEIFSKGPPLARAPHLLPPPVCPAPGGGNNRGEVRLPEPARGVVDQW